MTGHRKGNCGGKFTLLSDWDDWAELELGAFVFSGDGPESLDRREIVDCDYPPPGAE